MNRILVTGATGQIGSELVPALRKKYGSYHVVAAGHKRTPPNALVEEGPYTSLDVTDIEALTTIVQDFRIDTIFHLAALLSAIAEKNPQIAWKINMEGLQNVLEVSRAYGCAVFFPSSIGAFGPGTPRDHTPQDTIQRPNTMYGVCKVAGELLCDYYFTRFGVDTRGVRYPGLISYETLPGGGTTDYAVEIFYQGIQQKQYTCFLAEGTTLDMMYMPDAVRAAIELMEADPQQLKHRNAFNLSAMSFAPEELAGQIQKHIPAFTLHYQIDPVRQAIADSWPRHMDDQAAREEWGWQPQYDLAAMTKDMIEHLTKKLS
ncbi:L-threonine 3-dehydrogenase [Nitrosomonas communis]|uniref:Nucleoside-diphosphate-sugar epimerase n=1 Tax=Nitrosomonas communis TaxID=44574 RepID=A0A1H2RE39_9PROT|nr:L-threonine 3-dehydrogenase [Nitrosomonas communis]SDW17641.1 Nucleoside-diphosphate-sugar epimerase [Nitrosomonas communis]